MGKELIEPLFDENYRAKKIEELNSLPSALDKIKFWYELGLNWIDLSDSDGFNDLPLAPFKFKIPDNEFLEVNEWILKNFLRRTNRAKEYGTLLKFEDLVSDFEEGLSNAENQESMIREEQRKIDNSFESSRMPRVTGFLKPQVFPSFGFNSDYFADNSSFFDYYKYKQKPNYSKVYPRVMQIVMIENGYTLARFREYLDESLADFDKTENSNDSEISIAQKLLLLQELEILQHLKTKIKVDAKIHTVLSLLIGGKPEYLKKTMAIVANSGSKVQNAENLEFVSNVLDSAGLEKEATGVRKRLEKKYKK
jgi:hypothetical protein